MWLQGYYTRFNVVNTLKKKDLNLEFCGVNVC